MLRRPGVEEWGDLAGTRPSHQWRAGPPPLPGEWGQEVHVGREIEEFLRFSAEESRALAYTSPVLVRVMLVGSMPWGSVLGGMKVFMFGHCCHPLRRPSPFPATERLTRPQGRPRPPVRLAERRG